ncbi:MAG: T9SS type A sorting domain-containing protein [Aureispira sp.]|nr:T9SS type A sorting domain-containing protein [Aureispira sp.]
MKNCRPPITVFIMLLFLFNSNYTTAQNAISSDDLQEQISPPQNPQPNLAQKHNPSTNNLNRSCTTPSAPAASGDELCGSAGTATLSATASAGGTLKWYNVASGGTELGTGATYSPVVVGTSNFYVEEEVTSGGSGGGGPTTLTTPLNTNNGQRGCMFDITATNTITVTQFSSCLYTGTTANYEIYYKTGSHVGSENNSAAWTLLGNATGVTGGATNVPVLIPITFSVTIPAGQTYAFYVTNDFGGGTSYTDGTAVGTLLASNTDLTLYEGVGKSYPFGLTFNVRNFNGIVHYNPGGAAPTTCTSSRTMVIAQVRQPQYIANNTNVTSNASCSSVEAGVTWTHYYHTSNPDNIIFSIAKDPNSLGNNSFTANAQVQCTGAGTYSSVENPAEPKGRFALKRYWNVNLLSGSIVDPVRVRFYYQNTEENDMYNAAVAFQGANGGVVSPKYWFKTVGSTYTPGGDLHLNGVYNSVELTNFIDNQTTSSGVNYVELRDITSFSGGSMIVGVVPPGVSTGSEEILLPLDLQSFSVHLENKQGLINWVTSNEQNVAYFEIERSANAVDFESIGEVQATNGTKDETNYYQLIDQSPLLGQSYYRIRIVEQDGSSALSPVKALSFENDQVANLAIQPNPFQDKLKVSFESPNQTTVKLALYNNLGHVVYEVEKKVNEGFNNVTILPQKEWVKGAYILQLKSEQFTVQKKVIKY